MSWLGATPILAALALTAANIAGAATITIDSAPDGKSALVTVDGVFESNDGDQFKSKTGFLSKAIVSFRSDGGNLVAGIQIGEAIRLKGFSSLVPGNARCASACALAWLGRARRFMSADSRIGFHAAYDKNSGKETGVGNAVLGAYLTRIGLAYPAVIYITQAPPASITWLSMAEAGKRGIDVELADAHLDAAAAAIPVAASNPDPARTKPDTNSRKTAAVSGPSAPSVPTVPSAPSAAPAPASGLRAESIVGSWGVASYHSEVNRLRAARAAIGQCFHPYVIDRGVAGAVRMLGHDNPDVQDMKIKVGAGKTYIGPGPVPGGPDDREVMFFDGRVLILKWTDPFVVIRYGIMVLVRCAE
jgi:hypothetical protein